MLQVTVGQLFRVVKTSLLGVILQSLPFYVGRLVLRSMLAMVTKRTWSCSRVCGLWSRHAGLLQDWQPSASRVYSSGADSSRQVAFWLGMLETGSFALGQSAWSPGNLRGSQLSELPGSLLHFQEPEPGSPTVACWGCLGVPWRIK